MSLKPKVHCLCASGISEGPKQVTQQRDGSAQHPPRPLPVVNEAKHDRVPGIAGRCGPALSQHHLEVTFLQSMEPHFYLDVIDGRHTIVPRYRGVSNKCLHYSDKISSAVEVLDDGVNPARGRGFQGVHSCDPPIPISPPQSNATEVWK